MTSMANLELIRADVQAGSIEWRAALELCMQKQRAWKTKEWREKRAAIIKSVCEICGSVDGPFVIQHTWHPRILAEIFDDLRRKPEYASEFRRLCSEDKYQYQSERQCCPQCFEGIVQRKDGMWRCQGSCRGLFDAPGKKMYTNTDRQAVREQLDDVHEIGKTAVIVWITETIRYCSLIDTITACKRCAFAYDKGYVLCDVCRRGYHRPGKFACGKCLDRLEHKEEEK